MTRSLEFGPTQNGIDIQSTRKLGAFSLGRSDANIVGTVRPGEHSVYFMPGWHTDGSVIAKNFDRHVEHIGPTFYSVHPLGQFSVDSHKERLLEARKADGHRPAKLFAQSQGTLTLSEAFSDPGFRDDFGEVESLVFCSPVSSKRDIYWKMRILSLVQMGLPLNKFTEAFNSLVLEKALASNYTHGDNVTDEEAYENNAASAETSLEACQTQLENIYGKDIADWDLSDFGKTVPNKKIVSSQNDFMVNSGRAAAVINHSYGGGFTYWHDLNRGKKEHGTGTEHVAGIVDALMDQNHDHYHTVGIGKPLAKVAFMDTIRSKFAASVVPK